MKKNILTLGLLTLILGAFSCCSDEETISDFSESDSSSCINVSKENPINLIENYIENTHGSTRAEESYLLSPIEYEGQTVMYVANYQEGGFDVFSAKLYAPMVLMSSDYGSIDMSDTDNMPESLVDVIWGIAQSIYEMTDTDAPTDESWVFGSDSYPIVTDSIDFSHRVPHTDPNNGYWKTDTIIVSRTLDSIPHLIQDHWSQIAPYNKYIKYVPDNNGEQVHAPVGCCALSTGEFLHYMYKEFGISPRAYSTAEYNSISNEYIFSNPTTTIWASLDSNIDSIAIVLGYISNSISTSYSINGTASSLYMISKFLNDSCDYNTSSLFYNNVNIKNQLLARIPTIASAACNLEGTGSNHCFIIDGLLSKNYYFVERKQWIRYVDPNRTGHGLIPEDGPYDPKDTEYRTLQISHDDFFQMNWGWGESDHDRLWLNASAPRWDIRDGLYFTSKLFYINVTMD